jgi:hypothetical protein
MAWASRDSNTLGARDYTMNADVDCGLFLAQSKRLERAKTTPSDRYFATVNESVLLKVPAVSARARP